MPVDHFHNESQYEPHSNEYFDLAYWFDDTYYEPGGPVIVLQGGETAGSSRLAYLQKGIVYQLSKATSGIGVILEHRYYGTSFPTANLTTKNLRFLTTAQALADQAYFAANVKFPGKEHMNLTAPGTPYLTYGGSYAGAFVAFMRVQYPNLYWGAISSSGVTEAIYDYWQYYEPVAEYAEPACIKTQQILTNVIDSILMKNDSALTKELKAVMQAPQLTNDQDFANYAGWAMGYWQNRNWDPAVNDPTWDEYCGNLTAKSNQWPATKSLASNVTQLLKQSAWAKNTSSLVLPMLNYIGFMNETFVVGCDGTLEGCYGLSDPTATMYTDKTLDNYGNLSWAYQYCTEWGYLSPGSTVPKDQLPLISRLLTVEFLAGFCTYAFNITTPPNVEAANKYGGFNISYPRLALIGGQADPWRPATPLATLPEPDRLNTTSTVNQPVVLIEGAVHHW